MPWKYFLVLTQTRISWSKHSISGSPIISLSMLIKLNKGKAKIRRKIKEISVEKVGEIVENIINIIIFAE